MTVNVNVKSLGKRKPEIAAAKLTLDGKPETAGELIALTVSACISQFEQRAHGEILGALTAQDISEKAAAGKISFGEVYGEKCVDREKAQKNALQCFEDGIYRIFLNGKMLEKADEKIEINEGSELTFVRLTMLTGRLW